MAAAIAIVEPNAGGHRLWFVRLLVEAAFSEFEDPMVHVFSSPRAVTSREWTTHLGDFVDRIQVHPIVEGPRWMRRVLSDAIRLPDLDLVVIPEADRWALAIADPSCRLPPTLTALVMRPHAQPGLSGGMKAIFKRATWSLVSRRREVTVVGLTLTGSSLPGSRWASVPDPVALSWSGSREEARTLLGLNQSELVNLIIGDLSERKGLIDALSAWKRVAHPDARLALVGHTHDQGLTARIAAISRQDPRVRFVPGYISDDAFDMWVAGSDRVLSLYHNVGSSGVSLRAWALGTPVVVWKGSYLDEAMSGLGAATVSVRPGELHHVLGSMGTRMGMVLSRPSAQDLAARNLRFTRSLLGISGPS